MAVNVSRVPLPQSARRLARSMVRGAARVAWLERLAGPAYARYFNRARGHIRLFRGIYPDFATAARDLPTNRPIGYDNPESAFRIFDEWLQIYAYDYPIMVWLGKLLPHASVVFDWGGNVALKYFAYRKYLSYPSNLEWRVCELPAIVEAGRGVAAREGASAVTFTTAFEDIAGADILLAAGSLHFIEDPFALLRGAATLPKHLLLAKVPTYDRPSAVTLSNMGTAICLYHLFNRAEFVAKIEALGYRLVDEWQTSDGYCRVPFYPDHAIDAYSGFYFERSP
jgi:putative methyltransferase (TIGR04325 family)